MLIQVRERMFKEFRSIMPESLFKSPYELTEDLGFTVDAWEQFLADREVVNFIEQNLTKYVEINARKAIQKLSEKELASSEVTAINKLLENSSLLQSKHDTKETIVLTYVPPRKEETM